MTQKPSKTSIPHFKSIEEEAEFWDTHSTTEFEDEFEPVEDLRFVVLRGRPKKAITVRLDEDTFAILTKKASEYGVGPSALVRMWVLDRLVKERGPNKSRQY